MYASGLTVDSLSAGPVYGSIATFHGLAVVIDTYPNDETSDVSRCTDKCFWSLSYFVMSVASAFVLKQDFSQAMDFFFLLSVYSFDTFIVLQ